MDPAVVGAADEEGAVLGEGGADLRVAIVVPLVLGPQVEACAGSAAASAQERLAKRCSAGRRPIRSMCCWHAALHD